MMRRNNTSSAYDFKSIEQMELGNTEKIEKDRKSAAVEPRKRTGFAALAKYLCMGAVIGSVCFLIIGNEMKMTELSDRAATLKSQLTKQQSEQVRMEAKEESLYNSAAVEQYVQNNLNMIKLEKANVEYVQLESKDKMVRSTPQSSHGSYFMRGVTNCLGRIAEYLS